MVGKRSTTEIDPHLSMYFKSYYEFLNLEGEGYSKGPSLSLSSASWSPRGSSYHQFCSLEISVTPNAQLCLIFCFFLLVAETTPYGCFFQMPKEFRQVWLAE